MGIVCLELYFDCLHPPMSSNWIISHGKAEVSLLSRHSHNDLYLRQQICSQFMLRQREYVDMVLVMYNVATLIDLIYLKKIILKHFFKNMFVTFMHYITWTQFSKFVYN